jgi:hypothetical protein
MATDALAAYLHDHLAGATAGMETLELLRERHGAEPLGRFASELLAEVAEDRDVLQRLAESLGAGTSPLKDAVAWVAEKASRIKLSPTVAGELGTFEALETLALGILGKRALWRVLASLARREPCLQGLDYEALAQRAQAQHDLVEVRRLEVARRVFEPVSA